MIIPRHADASQCVYIYILVSKHIATQTSHRNSIVLFVECLVVANGINVGGSADFYQNEFASQIYTPNLCIPIYPHISLYIYI